MGGGGWVENFELGMGLKRPQLLKEGIKLNWTFKGVGWGSKLEDLPWEG